MIREMEAGRLSHKALVSLQESEAGRAKKLKQAAPLLQRLLMAPYLLGPAFLTRGDQARLGSGVVSPRDINRALEQPPSSTEQILHPEKYLAREEPTEVRLPDLAVALGPGWRQLRSDVLGELDFRILLQQFSSPDNAALGAAGWAGDRFMLLENQQGMNVLVIDSLWDTNDEAGEFFNHYVATVNRRYGRRATRSQDAPSTITWATPNGAMSIQKWGPRVAIVMAPEVSQLQTVAAALTGVQGPAPAQLPR
jgi:hypothetical protein